MREELSHGISPISDIFGGALQYTFKRRGVVGSMQLEPFFYICLDVQVVFLDSV